MLSFSGNCRTAPRLAVPVCTPHQQWVGAGCSTPPPTLALVSCRIFFTLANFVAVHEDITLWFSLVTNEAEHLLLLVNIWISFSGQCQCVTLIFFFCHVLLICKSSLYISIMSSLSDLYIAIISFHSEVAF